MTTAKTTSSKKQDKPMYRCLRDNFAYCVGKPNFADHGRQVSSSPNEAGNLILIGATCSRDPKTCRKYRTLSQMVAAAKED